MIKICEDAGHGGSDPGAVDPKDKIQDDEIYDDEIYSEESDLNLEFSKIFRERAQKEYEIISTRDEDKYILLHKRSNMANVEKADIFISFHCNAAGAESARGIETLYHPKSKEGKKLAAAIQKEMVAVTDTPDRGIKSRNNLHVLNKTHMPAVLIEFGFITNVEEERLLNDREYQKKLIEAILVGVRKYEGKDKDYENHWAEKEIEKAMKAGVFSKTDEFRPNDTMTRAEMAVVVNRLLGWSNENR
jgi:N-acetylmuramoyl-L-alanine amidase